MTRTAPRTYSVTKADFPLAISVQGTALSTLQILANVRVTDTALKLLESIDLDLTATTATSSEDLRLPKETRAGTQVHLELLASFATANAANPSYKVTVTPGTGTPATLTLKPLSTSPFTRAHLVFNF